MQEKSWLSTVIGIGKDGHRLLHEVQSRMASENSDATKDGGIELCHYWKLLTDGDIDTKELEHNCRDIAVAFLLVDVSDENNIRYAQEIGKFVSTQRYAVSVAILSGIDPVQITAAATQLFSDIDAAIDYATEEKEDTFQDLMSRLTSKQKSLLRALARAGRNAKPTSEEFIKKYRLTTASAIQRSLSALQDKDIITNENGSYFIYDYFLNYWLNK